MRRASPAVFMLLALAACDFGERQRRDWPPVNHVCGEAPSPRWRRDPHAALAVLTYAGSTMPDYDYRAVWLCSDVGQCHPVFSFNESQDVAAQWRRDGTLEIVHTATAARLHPPPKRTRVRPPRIVARGLANGTRDLPSQLSPDPYGRILTTGNPCRPALKFERRR